MLSNWHTIPNLVHCRMIILQMLLLVVLSSNLLCYADIPFQCLLEIDLVRKRPQYQWASTVSLCMQGNCFRRNQIKERWSKIHTCWHRLRCTAYIERHIQAEEQSYICGDVLNYRAATKEWGYGRCSCTIVCCTDLHMQLAGTTGALCLCFPSALGQKQAPEQVTLCLEPSHHQLVYAAVPQGTPSDPGPVT